MHVFSYKMQFNKISCHKLGIKCGKGFCRNEATCGEMSSEVCKQVTKKEVEAMKKNGKTILPICSYLIVQAAGTIVIMFLLSSGESVKNVKCKENDKCTVCATETDYECISEKGKQAM